MEHSNSTNGVFSNEEMEYLRGEKRNAPRGSRLPNAMPIWVRRKLILNTEMRSAQTMPATPKQVTPVDSDQREQMARRLTLAKVI